MNRADYLLLVGLFSFIWALVLNSNTLVYLAGMSIWIGWILMFLDMRV